MTSDCVFVHKILINMEVDWKVDQRIDKESRINFSGHSLRKRIRMDIFCRSACTRLVIMVAKPSGKAINGRNNSEKLLAFSDFLEMTSLVTYIPGLAKV